ncbi:MAG: transcription-repair coupling factor [Pseudomonadota bacterium]|nr:transcription-repair coupling factor [Pseudomonadota bacterium]
MINLQLINSIKIEEITSVGRTIGPSQALLIYEIMNSSNCPSIVVAENIKHAKQLQREIDFFCSNNLSADYFPEWETLPYDNFSPHQEIISKRLGILSKSINKDKRITIVTPSSLLNRLPPTEYIRSRSFCINVNEELSHQYFIESLIRNGYNRVNHVEEHGEFANRGSLVDVYPMGIMHPIRIEIYDDKVESIKVFDINSQISQKKIHSLNIIPAKEVPLDQDAVKYFRSRYRERFEGQPAKSKIYREISDGNSYGGIEYYLTLFFKKTNDFLKYFPHNTLVFLPVNIKEIVNESWSDIQERYNLHSENNEKNLLHPDEAFIPAKEITKKLKNFKTIEYSRHSLEERVGVININTSFPPNIKINAQHKEPSLGLRKFIKSFNGQVLFTAESYGHQETMMNFLKDLGIKIHRINHWQDIYTKKRSMLITIAPFKQSAIIKDTNIAIIAGQQLFYEKPKQRKIGRKERDPELIIKQLTDLSIGAPVVHIVYGVGRYQGLTQLNYGNEDEEFLHLEYADGDKLYVPVHSLELISRYTGSSPENAPIHKLGSDQWIKAKKRAVKRIHDVAAELLDIYAKRSARTGHSFVWSKNDYENFENDFPYETTNDQENAIQSVLDDLSSNKPMDRVICGDVGFGKTEVALRAALIVALEGKQVIVLVPTTLLANQHEKTFKDRFAKWPINISVLSRFQSQKNIKTTIAEIESGKVDIVIGTHKILQHIKSFKKLGLAIIDEEHRFGVRHKEIIKNLKNNIDILTLTATPIPRTLNMALGGIRELSLITTPPLNRLTIKTFTSEWNDLVIQEACLREIKRGGQIYFVHNRIEDIENIKLRLKKIIPQAKIKIGHGQMRETQLEKVMSQFYHNEFNLLLCTTIIESGLDIPKANTIIINRADRFGLAQLHQLRGRVGRSHHRAYAYLLTPPKNTLTMDANKRLEAISSLEDLGSGFVLATHDLEIRGAGELLGDIQSGQIQQIGFSLYTDLLSRTVEAMKKGDSVNLEEPFDVGVEIDLRIPCLLPTDYVPDVHMRLILYKRIASAKEDELLDIKIELIDRFGLLPKETEYLLRMTKIKKICNKNGIIKINIDAQGGNIKFDKKSNINTNELIKVISDHEIYRMKSSHHLNFKITLTSPEERFDFIEALLDRLII